MLCGDQQDGAGVGRWKNSWLCVHLTVIGKNNFLCGIPAEPDWPPRGQQLFTNTFWGEKQTTSDLEVVTKVATFPDSFLNWSEQLVDGLGHRQLLPPCGQQRQHNSFYHSGESCLVCRGTTQLVTSAQDFFFFFFYKAETGNVYLSSFFFVLF